MVRRPVIAVGGLAALALVAALWPRGDAGPASPAASPDTPASRAGRGPDTLPSIDLARVDAARSEAPVGRRDLFDFGQAPPRRGAAPAFASATPSPAPAPPPPPSAPSGPASAAAAGPAPANVRYIGRLDRRGLQVAVLLTDKDEVLTGRVGEVVSSFKIVSIGLESVDIQDVGSGRVRRVPLKGK